MIFIVLFCIAGGVALTAYLVNAYMSYAGERTIERNKREWARSAEKHKEFLESSDLMDATILSAMSWGRQNNWPVINFRLRIDHPDGAYEAEVEQTVSPTKVHHCEEGAKVRVFVDKDDRKRVKVTF